MAVKKGGRTTKKIGAGIKPLVERKGPVEDYHARADKIANSILEKHRKGKVIDYARAGDELRAQGLEAHARAAFERAAKLLLKSDPGHAGRLFEKAHEFEKALAAYEKAGAQNDVVRIRGKLKGTGEGTRRGWYSRH